MPGIDVIVEEEGVYTQFLRHKVPVRFHFNTVVYQYFSKKTNKHSQNYGQWILFLIVNEIINDLVRFKNIFISKRFLKFKNIQYSYQDTL